MSDVILPKGYVPEPEPELVEDEFPAVEQPAQVPPPEPLASFRSLADADDDERENGLAEIAWMDAGSVDPSDVYGAEQWQSMVVADPYDGAPDAWNQFAEDWTLNMTPSSRAAAMSRVSFAESMRPLVEEIVSAVGDSRFVTDPAAFAKQVSAARYARRRTYG